MINVSIIGCGGIGSFFVKYFLEMKTLYLPNTLFMIKLFDKDVVEEKNLTYQDFSVNDLMISKSEALSKKYENENILFHNDYINENNLNLLEKSNYIILCVDNHKTRQMVYKYCLDNKKWLIDLRAQGTIWGITVVDGEKNMEYYNNTIFKNEKTLELKGSCQLASDIENNTLKNSNRVVAFYCAYCFMLQRIRGEAINIKEFKTVF